jgi:hypothetical protein
MQLAVYIDRALARKHVQKFLLIPVAVVFGGVAARQYGDQMHTYVVEANRITQGLGASHGVRV